MQTFVPFGADFKSNAQVLDRARLGKQRVETFQILNALQGLSKGWVNHPATRMWRGYEPALAYYGIVMCKEWRRRGYMDSMLTRFGPFLDDQIILPDWLERDDIMESHRSNLIRKRPDIYQPVWPTVPDDLPYVWPV